MIEMQKKLGQELREFLATAKLCDRKWLDGIKLRIYVRLEPAVCVEYRGSEVVGDVGRFGRLNIANVEYFNPEDWEEFARRWFIDFCEYAHRENPYTYTMIESVEKDVAQILWADFDWKIENQPGCLFKRKNRGPVPGEWWHEPTPSHG